MGQALAMPPAREEPVQVVVAAVEEEEVGAAAGDPVPAPARMHRPHTLRKPKPNLVRPTQAMPNSNSSKHQAGAPASGPVLVSAVWVVRC